MNMTVTEKAKKEVLHITQEQNLSLSEVVLRVRVLGGGCSGFQTKLDLDGDWDEAKDNLLDVGEGVKLCVDKRSALYLEGSTVDFLDDGDLSKRGFLIHNPAATGRCGCGSSFSLN